MYPHVGEAFIPVRRSSCAAEEIYRNIAKFCQSADVEGFTKSIDFEDGGAIIQSTKDGLKVHVFAWDILTFLGIRALIEGGLPKVIFRSVESVEWLPQIKAPVTRTDTIKAKSARVFGIE
ncbi:SMa0974 family conjugal transfer regulator [Brucella intermedia]|uniref:SMa0974 family conjugal transfer regulator n=1 Tax=Brucella intermedia TaxID=94625 RepID=UPI0023609C2E|nr:hypothetical protein [Brucella intermedia]